MNGDTWIIIGTFITFGVAVVGIFIYQLIYTKDMTYKIIEKIDEKIEKIDITMNARMDRMDTHIDRLDDRMTYFERIMIERGFSPMSRSMNNNND